MLSEVYPFRKRFHLLFPYFHEDIFAELTGLSLKIYFHTLVYKMSEQEYIIVYSSNTNIIRVSDGPAYLPFVKKVATTKWGRRLTKLGLQEDCVCIFDNVSLFFNYWTPRRIHDRSYCRDIINLHFGFSNILTESAIDIIREILLVLTYYVDNKVYICAVISKRFNVSGDCCYVILSYMERLKLISHDSSMRFPSVIKEGTQFLHIHDYVPNRDNSDLTNFMFDRFGVDVDLNSVRGFRGQRDIVPVLLTDV